MAFPLAMSFPHLWVGKQLNDLKIDRYTLPPLAKSIEDKPTAQSSFQTPKLRADIQKKNKKQQQKPVVTHVTFLFLGATAVAGAVS